MLGNPVQESGAFDVADVWVTGNQISVKYSNLGACSLKLNSTTIAMLSGSGAYLYTLAAQPGSYVLSCGSVSKTIQIVAYALRFA